MSQFVIIGGGTGIGRAIAKDLAEQHDVLVLSRKASEKELPTSIDCENIDVLSDDIEQILPEHIDGLVYCPGSINLKPFRSLKDDDFLEDYRINVLGAIKSIRAARKALQKSPEASILLFSTVAVSQGMNFHSSIAAAKGAIEGLTRSLAAEFAPKIRVNAIAPSLIETPLSQKFLATEKLQESSKNRHPLKQYGRAEDVAKLAQFLLSPAAKFVSGQIYGMDGGLSSLR